MAIALVPAAKMQELDRVTIEDIGIPGPVLMEVAGRGCAERVEELLPIERDGRVAVICGKGNNGGDGYVAARHLLHAGHQVDVFLLAKADSLSGDAQLNYKILTKLGGKVTSIDRAEQLAEIELDSYDVILDAIFGTGLSSAVRGIYAKAIEAINASQAAVVAVDIPSGISSDTGSVMGVAVKACRTVTFAHLKPGQLVFPGAKHCGDLSCVDIGIPPKLTPDGPGSTWLLTDEDIAPRLGRREADAHKGRFGHLVVVAGSPTMPGAAGLCCRSAVTAGAGLVTLAADQAVLERVVAGPVEFMGTEATTFDQLADFCRNKQALAIGPGLAGSPETAELVGRLVAEIDLPMVIDAEGLNHLAGQLDLLNQASAPRVLTPHPGEMARLLNCTTADVQADRLAAARQLAGRYNCIVVLKGAGTIVADPDQTAYVVPTGNPGMASGGSGDVLTGIISSFITQGMAASDAACVGAYVHGRSGDLVCETEGQRALTAGKMIAALGPVIARFESFMDAEDDS
ncbi:MAG: NAD(P)H-hydrate dehydratase [Deltaproteobacteria bacterium]|nr:NAD(P)H-hydrate dehydratase [Deltaproteobacteria bacterium]